MKWLRVILQRLRRARGGEVNYVNVGVIQLGQCGTCGMRLSNDELFSHIAREHT